MSKAAEASGNLRKLIGNEQANKMGNYTESTGGGTPIPRGEKLKDHPEAKRVKQPRDEEGKFTYNAVNFKTLKYGPSRGKTVPPFLRGLHLDTNLISANGKVITDGKRWNISGLEMNKQELLNNFKEFRGNEEGFGDFEKAKFSGVRGRPSKQEKEIMNSGKAHGYFEDTKELGQYNSTQDLQDNMKKLRREQENRKYRKTLLGIQGKLGEKGVNKSIPEIKEMIKSGEVARILGPNYLSDVLEGRVTKKGSKENGNAGQAQDTKPESGVDKQNNQETPQNNQETPQNGSEVGSEVSGEDNNTNQEQNVSSDNANNDVPNNNEVPETPQDNTAEKGVQNNRMPTGGGETPSGNGNIGELNKVQGTASDNEIQNQNAEQKNNVPTGGGETPSGNGQVGEVQGANGAENNTQKNTVNHKAFDSKEIQDAKYNSNVFYRKYKNQIDGLNGYARSLGVDMNVTRAIVSGEYESFKDIENAIAEDYKKQNGEYPQPYSGAGSEEVEAPSQDTNENISNEQQTNANNRAGYKEKFDDSTYEMAKNDPEGFYERYQGTIDNLLDYCEDTLGDELGITFEDIRMYVAKNPKLKNFGMLKKVFDNQYKELTGKDPVKDEFKDEFSQKTKEAYQAMRQFDAEEAQRKKDEQNRQKQQKEKEKNLQKQNEEYIKKAKELNKQKRNEEKAAAIEQSNKERGLGPDYVNKRKVDYDRQLDETDLNNLKNDREKFKQDNYSTLMNLRDYAKNELNIKKATVNKMLNLMAKSNYTTFGQLKKRLESYKGGSIK